MFVPIDRLPPILGDLIADGRAAGPARPWLGITTEEVHGRLVVEPRDAGEPGREGRRAARRHHSRRQRRGARSLADFYRKIWAVGEAGATVPLDVLQDNEKRRIDVKSMNRLDHLKLKSTF